jgi:hypothetical protein
MQFAKLFVGVMKTILASLASHDTSSPSCPSTTRDSVSMQQSPQEVHPSISVNHNGIFEMTSIHRDEHPNISNNNPTWRIEHSEKGGGGVDTHIHNDNHPKNETLSEENDNDDTDDLDSMDDVHNERGDHGQASVNDNVQHEHHESSVKVQNMRMEDSISSSVDDKTYNTVRKKHWYKTIYPVLVSYINECQNVIQMCKMDIINRNEARFSIVVTILILASCTTVLNILSQGVSYVVLNRAHDDEYGAEIISIVTNVLTTIFSVSIQILSMKQRKSANAEFNSKSAIQIIEKFRTLFWQISHDMGFSTRMSITAMNKLLREYTIQIQTLRDELPAELLQKHMIQIRSNANRSPVHVRIDLEDRDFNGHVTETENNNSNSHCGIDLTHAMMMIDRSPSMLIQRFRENNNHYNSSDDGK